MDSVRPASKMKILSLDQALVTTGWAIFKQNKLVKSGTFSIKSTLPIGARLGAFWKELNNLYSIYEFEYIAFEDIQNQNNNETYKKLAMVQSAIYLWCFFQNVMCGVASPSHWRSVLGGNFGKKREEQKQAAINYVKNYCDKEVSSDEADAVCIGLAYIKEKEKNKRVF